MRPLIVAGAADGSPQQTLVAVKIEIVSMRIPPRPDSFPCRTPSASATARSARKKQEAGELCGDKAI